MPGGFGALYPVLRAMEEAGQSQHGTSWKDFGAAQFALPGAVDRMRAVASAQEAAVTGPPGDPRHPRWPGQPPPARPRRGGAASRPEGAARSERAARPESPAWPEGISWPEGSVWADEAAGTGHPAAGSATASDAAAWPPDRCGRERECRRRSPGSLWPRERRAREWKCRVRRPGGLGWRARRGRRPGGRCRGCGGTATPGTGPSITVLAAADPANAFGAALPWPVRPGEVPGAHRPGRKAGALVVLSDGEARALRGARWQDPALLDQ